MATTTACINTQLTTDRKTQADTTTPTLKTRELAGLLSSTIHYHRKDLFYARLALGADINFSGLDDRNQSVNPPIIDAILFYNDWAFKTLLDKGADINKASKGDFVPLFHAVSHGNLRIVRELIAKGADPLDYRQGTTCLSLALECLRSGTLLESQSRWRYENESPDTNNTALKQQISDFFLQENAYIPPKPSQAIPFVAPEQIHVYSAGNLDIIGFLLLKGVPPTMAVSETDRSPLAVVQNPTKYFDIFRSDSREKLEYIGTDPEKPNILLFTMTLGNKRGTGTIPSIVVHYDLEPAKKLIEAAALSHSNPHLQSQLDAVNAKLHGATTQFATEMKGVKEAFHYDEKQEIERFKLFIKDYPNAEEAYNTIFSRLKSIHKSAQAVAGGGVVVSEGSLGLVAKVLNLSTAVVDAIPLVGGAASKLFELAASATREVDSRRQTNIYKNIAAMVPATGAGRIFESVARKLTMAYLSQFQRLQTKEEARSHMSRPRELVQDSLKGQFISPAERVAAFAIIWMMDDVFNNMHQSQIEMALKEPNGLETLLLNVVTQRKPEQGVETFWDTWNTIVKNLDINQIPTRTQSGAISAETWHPADFWTMPGVVVQNSSAVQYFAGNNTKTNVAKFGWRSGSLEDVAALGLTPTTETALLPQASSQTTSSTATPSANSRLTPPSPTVMYAYPNTPQASANASTTSSPAASTQAPKPEPTLEPPAPKRNRSPFGRLRAACLKAS